MDLIKLLRMQDHSVGGPLKAKGMTNQIALSPVTPLASRLETHFFLDPNYHWMWKLPLISANERSWQFPEKQILEAFLEIVWNSQGNK